MTTCEPRLGSDDRTQGLRRRHHRRDERGASAVEYGLMIAGIAALIAIAVFTFGRGGTGLFDNSCSKILANSYVGGKCSS